MSKTLHYRACHLCEAICGLAIETESDEGGVPRIRSIKGDPQDSFSRGHVCPKAVALQDIQDDPDRLRQPLRRVGSEWQPIGWDEAFALVASRLGEIRERVEREVRQRVNGVLLNYYRDGQDSMGWHSDDEPELRRDPLVASLSLGGSRRFDLRRKGQTRIAHSLELTHGSLLVMRGATQHHWQHQVAKTRRSCMPRLNLTFRLVYPQP